MNHCWMDRQTDRGKGQSTTFDTTKINKAFRVYCQDVLAALVLVQTALNGPGQYHCKVTYKAHLLPAYYDINYTSRNVKTFYIDDCTLATKERQLVANLGLHVGTLMVSSICNMKKIQEYLY